MTLSNILRNIGGEFEVGRALVVGAAGAAIISPIGFQAWAMANGASFDVTAWCLAYPGGLAALVTSGILSVGKKDKDVEAARKIAKEGTAQ